MDRVSFRLRVTPDRLAEYRAAHLAVWPELVEEMRRAGIRNYSIFGDGPDQFGYLECNDWKMTSARLQIGEAHQRWQSTMEPMFDPAAPYSQGARLYEVFHLE